MREITAPKIWNSLKLGEVATLQRGYDLPSAEREPGNVPIISSGGVTGWHSEAKHDAPGVVTGRYGSIGELYWVEEPYWPLNTALFVRNFHGNDERFIFYLLQSVDFKRLSDKTGVPGVNRNDVHKLNVALPPLSEQRKIAEILRTWDEAIEISTNLIELRRRQYLGLRNQLIDWWSNEQTRLGDLVDPVSRPVPKPVTPYVAASIRSHGKGAYSRQVKDPATVAMDTLYEIKEGDLVANITFAWEGAIALIGEEQGGCLVSHRFPAYRPISSKVNSRFLRHAVRMSRFTYMLTTISPGGAGRNRVLNKKYFQNLNVPCPVLSEQDRIAQILDDAEAAIAVEELYRSALTRQKRGLMQKLLTGEWRVTP